MRIISSILILIVSFTQAYSQKSVTTYYNPFWLLSSKEYSSFYRIATIDTNTYKFKGIVKDYYKNGRLQMIGTYRAGLKQGEFLFYFQSGNLKTKGYYKDNVRWGIWTNYYEDGKVREKIVFDNIFLSILEYYDKDGNPKVSDGRGVWETQYFDEFAMKYVAITGSFKDSVRHGEWEYYSDYPAKEENEYEKLPLVENYENGRFKSGEYHDHDGQIQKITFSNFEVLPETKKFLSTENWETSIYASRDEYPFLKFLHEVDSSVFPVTALAYFPGGTDSLRNKIARQIKLRKSYINSQQHLLCMFKIIINENGILEIEEDPNKSIVELFPGHSVFYKQVLAAITKLPDWRPASRKQKYVLSHFMLYIMLDNGTVSVKLVNVNQLILDPDLKLIALLFHCQPIFYIQHRS